MEEDCLLPILGKPKGKPENNRNIKKNLDCKCKKIKEENNNKNVKKKKPTKNYNKKSENKCQKTMKKNQKKIRIETIKTLIHHQPSRKHQYKINCGYRYDSDPDSRFPTIDLI